MSIGLGHYLAVGAILFTLGAIGVMVRRNPLVILICIELMLNAVNLAFVAFSREFNQLDGLIFVFFVIVVAAAEAAVGLAIVMVIARNRKSLNVEDVNLMKF